MFDHVEFAVNDYAASKAFFLKALEPLGVAVGSKRTPGLWCRALHKGAGFIVPIPNRADAGASSLGMFSKLTLFLMRDAGGQQ